MVPGAAAGVRALAAPLAGVDDRGGKVMPDAIAVAPRPGAGANPVRWPPAGTLVVAGTAAAAGVALVPLLWGNVFPDEGWYLHAGLEVRAGRLPYRDFAFFQAPLSPYLLAAAGGDLMLGRIITLMCGLGAWVLALSMAARHGPHAVVLAILLGATNAYTWRWMTVCRNIAPAALLVMAALTLLAPGRPGRLVAAGLAGALAAATRASAAGALVGMGLVLAARGRWHDVAWMVAGAALGLTAAVGPFALADPGAFLHCNLLYHTGLYEGGADWIEVAVSKLHGLARFADKHALVLMALALWWRRPGSGWGDDPRPAAALATAMAMTVLHAVPGGFRPEYHELALFPLIAGLAPCLAPGLATSGGATLAVVAGLSLAQVGLARTHLVSHGGWNRGLIERLGRATAAACPPGEPVLSFIPDVAIAAGRPLGEGLAMASVSLAAPSVSAREALRLHVVTLETVARVLEEGRMGAVVWAGLTDVDPRRVRLYDRAARGRVERALRARYTPTARVDRWTIWRRR